MSNYQLILFTFAALVAYMIVTDRNVSEYIVLQVELLGIRIQKYYLLVKLHPRNFITTWQMNRRIKKIAKEFAKKYNLPDE